MITVLAMGWNHRKVESLHKTLVKRFVKVRRLHCMFTLRGLRCFLGSGGVLTYICLVMVL